MHPKDADEMANSVDPDQTASTEAVWSWSTLFAETYLSQYLKLLRYPRNMYEASTMSPLPDILNFSMKYFILSKVYSDEGGME